MAKVTPEAVLDLLAWGDKAVAEKRENFPGITYEEGVVDAVRWLCWDGPNPSEMPFNGFSGEAEDAAAIEIEIEGAA